MIDYIKGIIVELSPAELILENNGIGYSILISLQTFQALQDKKEATVYIFHYLREDAELFYSKLAGVSEPEHKRKIIGEEFIRVFEEEAKKIGAVDFLVQGTIYPDVVESGLGGESAVIKSHHNVGGLPDYVDFKEIIEPLRNLFKDEVRKVGLELGIPEHLVFRQPFPGPGLGIRIIGEVTAEKVKIVQDADAIYREEIANAGLDREINQYFAALTNMRSVGVMGDERTYDYAVALPFLYFNIKAANCTFDNHTVFFLFLFPLFLPLVLTLSLFLCIKTMFFHLGIIFPGHLL